MNEQLAWTDAAWKDYLYWQTQDKKTLKRINKLITECKRNPFEGIGKPEPLKENLSKKRKRTPPDIRVEVNFASLANLAGSEYIV
ncbi:Txe/YoeB family addiction module toxin [Psychrobacter celer]|uniref:Txe/YoeB family addiction module toxin n=1 Tax=Psychrobacter celer TaxID=306572 RepID=UPI003FD46CB9